MVWLYFFCVIFILLMLIKIKILVNVNSENETQIFLKIFIFKFKILPHSNKKKISHKQKLDVPAKHHSKELKKSNQVNLFKSFFEKSDLFFLILKPTIDLLIFLNKGFKIKKLNLELILASDDVFDTAVLHGRICNYFGVILKLIQSVFKIEVEKITISPNFLSDKLTYCFKCSMQIYFIRIVIGLFKYLIIVFIKIWFYKIKLKSRSD